MKKFCITILTSLVVLGAYSQVEGTVDSKTTKKLSKEQRLAMRQAEEEVTAKLVDWMIEKRQFVLEANYLSNQTGERIIVNSRLNFIAVDSSRITIQLASTSGIGGSNGMGGITADGNITRFEVAKVGRNKDSYNIRILAMTHVGTFDITFDISPSSNTDASISGNTRGRLNYHGRLIPLKMSKVFKGMSI